MIYPSKKDGWLVLVVEGNLPGGTRAPDEWTRTPRRPSRACLRGELTTEARSH